MFAEFVGAGALFGPEISGEMLGALEACKFGDLTNGVVGFSKQPGDLLDALASDLTEDRAVEASLEAFLQHATGCSHCAGNFGHGKASPVVLSDERDGLGNDWVIDGEDAGAVARNNVGGGDQDAPGACGFAEHHLVEELRTVITGFMEVEGDARKRGVGESTDEFIIVDTEDGNILRNAEAGGAAGFGDELAPVIV